MRIPEEIRHHKYQLLLHLVYWAGVGYIVLISNFNVNSPASYIESPANLLFHMMVFYVNWGLLVPRFLARGRLGNYIGAVILLIAAITVIRFPFDYLLRQLFETALEPEYFSGQLIRFTVSAFVMVIFSSAFRITGELIRSERRRRGLELEKTKAELAFLKTQINPHFLFNTLNSIYALSYKQSLETPEAILKLSHLMRYMLYDARDGENVDLEKEVEYLHNFIDLQKLRLPDKDSVVFEVTGNLNRLSIEPMLLIPLVENVFKHGIGEQGSGIKIRLEVTEKEVDLKTSNPIRENRPAVEEPGGIGLQNVRRRLELIYPGKHIFEAGEHEGNFTTHLHLYLR